MKTARANIINALHALENGKSAAEVTAWLQDAIDELKPVGRGVRLMRNPVIEGYKLTQVHNIVYVEHLDGDKFAHFVICPEKVTIYLKDRTPVDVKTLEAAIDYIKLVINLK
ncbi:hypothetical protein Pondi_00026 [Escherichia phage Pondi]|nr:hypothetical protein Pondi_00026 [Escherichia phage Pondi]